MAINDHVQSRSIDFGSGTTGTLQFSGAVTAGNLLLAGFRVASAGADLVTGVSDNVNGAWTRRVARLQTTDNHYLYIYDLATTAAGTPTVTIALSSSAGLRFGIQEASGFATATADQTTSAIGTSNTPSSGNTATTTAAAELLFAVISSSGGFSSAPLIPGTSYTVRQEVASGASQKITQESRVVSATGTYAGDGTFSNVSAESWAAAIATYKDAGPAAAPAIVASVADFKKEKLRQPDRVDA